MALDPSIFAALGTRPKSALEYLQEMAAMEDAGQRRESNRLALLTQRGQYEEQMAARDRGNRLRQALQGLGAGATDDQRIGVLESHGEFGQADTLRKTVLDRQRTQAQVAKDNAAQRSSELESQSKQINLVLQAVSASRDQASYTNAIRFLQASGIDTSNIPPQFDPQAVADFGVMALTAKERVDAQMRAQAQAEQSRHNKAQEGLTARGQNMTDARAREGLAQAESQFNRKLAAEGEKPLNDAQSKALLFGSRMQEADKTIGKLVASGTKTPSLIKQAAESVPGVGGALGMAANATVASDEQQQLEQAQRDFINATLRRESGAVISEAEFDNARRQYFPQVGDSNAVIAQKAKNRKLATQGILAEVPEKKRSSLSTNTGGASGSWGDGSGWKIEKAE